MHTYGSEASELEEAWRLALGCRLGSAEGRWVVVGREVGSEK